MTVIQDLLTGEKLRCTNCSRVIEGEQAFHITETEGEHEMVVETKCKECFYELTS